jgi:ubiquinone/menaquinone biosynthesis C-methylase UbiE
MAERARRPEDAPLGTAQVRDYWDEYPCGIQISDKDVGTAEFFEEIKTKFHDTYHAYAHSDALLNFRGYAGKAVLEIGCGTGIDALEFARHGARVTAIDLSPKNVELTRLYFAHHKLAAAIDVANAEELPFPADTFDLVVAIGVLYYTPNTQQAVDHIRRVLKPGGKAVCMFFNRRSWYTLLVRLSGTNIDHEDKDPPILTLYSVAEVRKLFGAFGTVDIEMERFPTRTIKRAGPLAWVYNHGFVPLCRLVPRAMMRPFGFHIIVKAVK